MISVPGRTRAQVEADRTATFCADIRRMRDEKIVAVSWRVDRHSREVSLGLDPTEDILPVLSYIQALCDVPQQSGFPASVVWPETI